MKKKKWGRGVSARPLSLFPLSLRPRPPAPRTRHGATPTPDPGRRRRPLPWNRLRPQAQPHGAGRCVLWGARIRGGGESERASERARRVASGERDRGAPSSSSLSHTHTPPLPTLRLRRGRDGGRPGGRPDCVSPGEKWSREGEGATAARGARPSLNLPPPSSPPFSSPLPLPGQHESLPGHDAGPRGRPGRHRRPNAGVDGGVRVGGAGREGGGARRGVRRCGARFFFFAVMCWSVR